MAGKKKAKKEIKETNRLWPFYSLIAAFGRRFGVLALGGLVVYSAIAVTNQTHQFRVATSDFNKLQDEQRILDLNWQKLRLEQSALAEHSRIEKIAIERLNMKHLDKKSEVIIEVESEVESKLKESK